MHEITIISDGSCPLGNRGPGGWASIIRWRTEEIVVAGSHPATTNNRAELMAAIEALRALKRPCRVELQTDSMYLKQGITEWLAKWTASGWVLCRSRNRIHYAELRSMPCTATLWTKYLIDKGLSTTRARHSLPRISETGLVLGAGGSPAPDCRNPGADSGQL